MRALSKLPRVGAIRQSSGEEANWRFAKNDVFSSDTSAIRGDRASRRYSSAEMVQWSAVVVALLAVICVAAAVIDSAEPLNKPVDNDDYLVKQVIIICIQLHDVNVIHTIII